MGAIYGFVGPNGSGKTTTIDMIFGLGEKDGGSITVLGLDHKRDERAVKLRTGYVSPELNYSPWTKLALSWRPTLLVLDEPTVGLDAISKRQVFAELLSAVQGEDRAVLISSHGITDLERFADHVGMIKNGQMLFEGPTADVVERYRLVDLSAEQAAGLEGQPGVLVQQRESRRWRLLLDGRVTPVERLSQMGLTPLSDSPVSLEELFVALGSR